MKYLFRVVTILILGMFVCRVHSLSIYDECVKKTGANEIDQAPVLRYDSPTTRNGQCLLACLMKREGLITQKNEINLKMLYEDIEPEKIHLHEVYKIKSQIYENCKIAEIKNSDECIVAKEFAECVYPKEIAAGVQKFTPYERRTYKYP